MKKLEDPDYMRPRKPLPPIAFNLSERLEEVIDDMVIKIKLGTEHRTECLKFLRFALKCWKYTAVNQLTEPVHANEVIQ